MTQGKIIAITGGPRTGKSTLVKFLAKQLDAVPFFEGEEKDFPSRVLEDIKSGERILELVLWFRNKLIKEYLRAMEIKKNGKIAILDTFWATNDVYIDEWVADNFEKECLKELAALDRQLFPWPDLVISLVPDEDTIRNFAIKGGRSFEQTEEFFKKQVDLNKAHTRYFKSTKKPNIQFIDVAGISYDNLGATSELVEKIKNWL